MGYRRITSWRHSVHGVEIGAGAKDGSRLNHHSIRSHNTQTHACIHWHAYRHMHTCTHTCTYTYAHTCMHTWIQAKTGTPHMHAHMHTHYNQDTPIVHPWIHYISANTSPVVPWCGVIGEKGERGEGMKGWRESILKGNGCRNQCTPTMEDTCTVVPLHNIDVMHTKCPPHKHIQQNKVVPICIYSPIVHTSHHSLYMHASTHAYYCNVTLQAVPAHE